MSSSSVGARNRGTPTPLGVEFVRLQAILRPRIPPNRPQDAQNGRESGFPDSTGFWESMTWVACHPVGQRRRLRADPQALARFKARLPAGRFDEDHVDRVVGHHGATLGRGPRDGARGLEDLAARRSRGGPETPGSEGAQPPASLARGHAECGPSEYAGLFPIIMQIPA